MQCEPGQQHHRTTGYWVFLFGCLILHRLRPHRLDAQDNPKMRNRPTGTNPECGNLIAGVSRAIKAWLSSVCAYLSLPSAIKMLIQRVLSYLLPAATHQYNYSYNSTALPEDQVTLLFDLHRALVSTPSVSYSESHAGHLLSRFLKGQGLTVDHQPVGEDRFNILAYKGLANDTKVVLTSHIDTVPPFFGYQVTQDGTQIYGRGSVDDKASVAAQTVAFLSLFESLEEGQVALLFDVGEEHGGDGIRWVEENIDYQWNTVIFGEPTELKLGVGHKGGFTGVVNVTGRASHSGYPELGIDANSILIDVLASIKAIEWPSDELLGPSTVNIGKLEGGVAANVISPHAEAHVLVRVSGELESLEGLINDAINSTGHGVHVEFGSSGFAHGPVFFDYKIPGFESIVLGYGTDAFALEKNAVKHKILYGPGTIHVAHGPEEHISTDELISAVQGYKDLIKWALEQ